MKQREKGRGEIEAQTREIERGGEREKEIEKERGDFVCFVGWFLDVLVNN